MEWFGISYKDNPFQMFSGTHLLVLAFFLFGAVLLFLFKRKLQMLPLRKVEVGIAWSLIIFELAYHGWMVKNDIWHAYQSLPLELCNISLIFGILLLLTERKGIYDVFLFISLLGATQAVVTPLLDFNFPHFRFLHFFYTHIMMIWIALYYTWVKGYYPTIRSVIKTVLFLNFLLPFILLVNHFTGGNYMFLSEKPKTASLLDYLGPYPWYIGSMEILLIVLSVFIWIVFRKKEEEQKSSIEGKSKI